MQKGNQRTYFIKIAIVWGVTLLLIVGIGALRVTTLNSNTDSASASVISRLISKPPLDRPNPASKKRDYLKKSDWPQGLRIYRDWWKERDAAVYVAEMRRESEDLRFGVELANTRLLGRETISSMAGRLAQQDIPLLAGVNGSFGLRGDRIGRGGIIFNLHIQDWELVSIPPRRDWWGFPPPSPWGETSFGVTTDGEFLLDAVELNGAIHINGESIEVDCINQIPESDCAAVLYTPRFGEQTLAQRSYEVILKGLELPLTGRYRSHFKIGAGQSAGQQHNSFQRSCVGTRLSISGKMECDIQGGWKQVRSKSHFHPPNGSESLMESGEISVSYGMEKLNRNLWNFTSQVEDPIIVTATERG